MILKMLGRSMYGIAYGAIVTFLALTILMIIDLNPPVTTIWLYMLASFAIGIYYGLASFIFEHETWSPLKKTIIHFSLSITFYFLIALSIGWVPPRFPAVFLTIIVFIIIYCLFWLGYTLYFKRVEASLNKTLKEK